MNLLFNVSNLRFGGGISVAQGLLEAVIPLRQGDNIYIIAPQDKGYERLGKAGHVSVEYVPAGADGEKSFFVARIRWEGIGTLGLQQEEMTYKPQSKITGSLANEWCEDGGCGLGGPAGGPPPCASPTGCVAPVIHLTGTQRDETLQLNWSITNGVPIGDQYCVYDGDYPPACSDNINLRSYLTALPAGGDDGTQHNFNVTVSNGGGAATSNTVSWKWTTTRVWVPPVTHPETRWDIWWRDYRCWAYDEQGRCYNEWGSPVGTWVCVHWETGCAVTENVVDTPGYYRDESKWVITQ